MARDIDDDLQKRKGGEKMIRILNIQSVSVQLIESNQLNDLLAP